MQQALRPMTLGEILDKTFVVYRKGFFIFLGVALLPIVGSLAIGVSSALLYELALQLNLGDLWVRASAKLPLWLPIWPRSLADIFIWPILVYVASSFFLQQKASLRAAVSQCTKRWQSWLGLGVFLFIAWVVFPQTAMQPLWKFRYEHFSPHPFGLSAGWAVLLYQWPFDLAGWIARYLLVLAFCLSVPAWSLERSNLRAALRRGWTLAKGNWFRVLAAMVMCSAVLKVLDVLLKALYELIFLILSTSFGQFRLLDIYALEFGVFAEGTAALLATPLLPIAVTLIYCDVRIRREGFGVEKLMEAAGLLAPVSTEAIPLTESSVLDPNAPREFPVTEL